MGSRAWVLPTGEEFPTLVPTTLLYGPLFHAMGNLGSFFGVVCAENKHRETRGWELRMVHVGTLLCQIEPVASRPGLASPYTRHLGPPNTFDYDA